MPFIDPANPGPWLASLSASRRRRADAKRQARRKRAGRGGGAALLAAMTLAAGGAVAQDGPPTTRSATTGSTVVALQRALGVSADGVIGPVTRRAIRNYQRNQGLAVDGIAGPATLASLGISGSAAPAKAQTRSTAVGRLGHARQDRPVRVGRRSDRRLVQRPVPRQVPVLACHLARPRRQRRSGRGARVRAGRDGGQAARPARHLALAGLRGLGARADQRHRSVSGSSRIRRMRAGWPALTELAGRSLVTTALVPTTELSPTVAPRRMHAP